MNDIALEADLPLVLLNIQTLFYKLSPDQQTGKVDLNSFHELCCSSSQFAGDHSMEESKKYFDLLDKDRDGQMSFNDFVAPLLPMLQPEVAALFTNDMRFKSETYNELRSVYNTVRKINKGETPTIEQLRLKIQERPDAVSNLIL